MPHASGPDLSRPIHANNGRTFRKAIPFVHGDSHVNQETANRLVQGSAATNDHTQPATDRLTHLKIHVLVVNEMQRAKEPLRFFDFCKLDGLIDEPATQSPRPFASGSHAFVDALQNTRNHRHQSRANFTSEFCHIPGRIRKVDPDSAQQVKINGHAFEHVRNR